MPVRQVKIMVLFAALSSMFCGIAAAAYLQVPILGGAEEAVTPAEMVEGVIGEVASKVDLILDENGNPTANFSKLTGLPLPQNEKEKLITVMVENHSTSRPGHSGFNSAGVVYETLVEGGITRFMLLFGSDYPERVGPVRSARPYFVGWADEEPTIYLHAGGSAEAFTKIYAATDLVNTDEGVAGTFRDYDFVKPHNLFANLQELAEAEENNVDWLKLTTPKFNFCGVLEEDCVRLVSDAVNTIAVKFSSEASYDMEFRYNPEEDRYYHFLAGAKHIDHATEEQVWTQNVIVMYAPYTVVDDAGRLDMETVGSGKAEFFMKGQHYTGTWKKANDHSLTVFYDANGKEFRFLPGRMWVVCTASSANVTLE